MDSPDSLVNPSSTYVVTGVQSSCIVQGYTHIMLFKVPIMLCSNSQHQANNYYAHCFVPIMLLISLNFNIICDNSFRNLRFMTTLFQITTQKRQATAILDYTTHY